MTVTDGNLPALHALATGTCHPDPVLKTQLLTAGMKVRKETQHKEMEARGRGGGGIGERVGESHLEKKREKIWNGNREGARLMEVMIQKGKKSEKGKGS